MSEASPNPETPAADAVVSSSSESYADAVRDAAERGRKVVDYGDLTAGLGYEPPDNAVRIQPPAGVIEHYVSDFTVTVAAGTKLADLQAALGEQNQFLPIDGVSPAATIAEIIAHNLYGPLRLGYGATRELLLGVRLIDGKGQLLRVGGRTVKNVAGYDVTRLMVGSLNTLGLIAEATFRTAAVPTSIATVEIAGVEPWDLDARMTSLLTTDAAPTYLAVDTTLADDGSATHRLHLGYHGSSTACEAQHGALTAWLRENLPAAQADRSDLTFAEDEQRRQALRTWQDSAGAWMKLIVPPAQTGQITRKLIDWLDGEARLFTLPNWGVIHLGAELSGDAARSLDRRVHGTLDAVGGLRVWMRRPSDATAAELPPFAPGQADWPIIRQLRKVFDPNDVINPGRFT